MTTTFVVVCSLMLHRPKLHAFHAQHHLKRRGDFEIAEGIAVCYVEAGSEFIGANAEQEALAHLDLKE